MQIIRTRHDGMMKPYRITVFGIPGHRQGCVAAWLKMSATDTTNTEISTSPVTTLISQRLANCVANFPAPHTPTHPSPGRHDPGLGGKFIEC